MGGKLAALEIQIDNIITILSFSCFIIDNIHASNYFRDKAVHRSAKIKLRLVGKCGSFVLTLIVSLHMLYS